ncbi:hypothetical protein AOLI_G00118960 [Acnodon oligacanthus]
MWNYANPAHVEVPTRSGIRTHNCHIRSPLQIITPLHVLSKTQTRKQERSLVSPDKRGETSTSHRLHLQSFLNALSWLPPALTLLRTSPRKPTANRLRVFRNRLRLPTPTSGIDRVDSSDSL